MLRDLSARGRRMPIAYRIEAPLGTVFLTYSGRVTDAELLTVYLRLYNDPAYRSGYNELADCRRITAFDVSAQTVRDTGEMAVVAAGSPPVPAKVAIVAAGDVVSSMAGLYQMAQELTSEI